MPKFVFQPSNWTDQSAPKVYPSRDTSAYPKTRKGPNPKAGASSFQLDRGECQTGHLLFAIGRDQAIEKLVVVGVNL